MSLFVRTGGSGSNPPVKINDLGITIPTSNSFTELTNGNPRDGYGQFNSIELKNSVDLFNLIKNGVLEASTNGIGANIVPSQYSANTALVNELIEVQLKAEKNIANGYPGLTSLSQILPSALPGFNTATADTFFRADGLGGGSWTKSTLIPNFYKVGTGGDVNFTSIAAAVSSAIANGASSSNPYLIEVFPGSYNEDPMILPPGVLVAGSLGARLPATNVTANDPNSTLFTLAGGSICGLDINGVTDPAHSLIRVATPFTLSLVINCNIYNCSTGLWVSSGASCVAIQLSVNISNVGYAVTDSAVKVDGAGSFLGVSAAFFSAPAILLPFYATNPIQTCITITNNARVELTTGLFQVAPKDSSQVAVQCNTGALVTLIGSDFNNNYTAINVGSSGTNSTVVLQGGKLENNTVNFGIQSASGTIFAVCSTDSKKNSITAGGTLSGFIQERGSKESIITGQTAYEFETSGRRLDVDTEYNDHVSSGLSTGGLVDGYGGLSVLVNSGTGWLRRDSPNLDVTHVSWNNTVVSIPANTTSYVFVSSETQSIEQNTSPPPDASIPLASIVTDGYSVRFIHNIIENTKDPGTVLYNYLVNTRKILFKSGLATSLGSTPTKFQVDFGTYYRALNIITYAGSGGDATFSAFYGPDGYAELTGQTNVDTVNYNVDGYLTPLNTDGYRTDTLYVTSDGKLSLIYGRRQFGDLLSAQTENFAPTFTMIDDSACRLATICVLKNYGIASIQDARPIANLSFGTVAGSGGSSITDHGQLTGLLDDDHPQYLLGSGIRAMTGNLDMGANSVINVNLVDGVDVSSHASRHNPGGLDPLATGVPVAVLVGVSPSAGSASSYALSDHQHSVAAGSPVSVSNANAPGSASSVARSDHVHAHGLLGGGAQHSVATTSVAGFMSAADKSSLDSLIATGLVRTVLNQTGMTLSKSRLVAPDGYTAGLVTVRYAQKTDPNYRPAIGITATDILDGYSGQIIITGIVGSVNTQPFSLSDEIVLGDDGYFVRPPPDNLGFTGEVQLIGSVIKVDPNDGLIIVDCAPGMDTVTAAQVFALAGTDGTPSDSNKYVTNSDPRNTNSRTPTGSAGGQLSGTYPNPSVVAITESSGPTALTIGTIQDGYGTVRVGSTFVGRAFGNTAGTFADGYDSRFPTVGEKQALAGTNALPSSSNKYVTETDSRLTNSRNPTGSAGGQLSGTYPNPSVVALTETSGPTALTYGAITDTQGLVRSGTTVIGKSFGTTTGTFADGYDSRFPTVGEKQALAGTNGLPSSSNKYITETDSRNTNARTPTGSAGGDLGNTYPNPKVAAITETGTNTSLVVGTINDTQGLVRSGSTLIGKSFGTTTGTFADGYDSRFPTAGEKQALAGTNGLPSSSNKYITETDSRNTNARTPTGAASGQLSGSYPSPSVVGLTESSGPTALTFGTIADTQGFVRSGTTVIGKSFGITTGTFADGYDSRFPTAGEKQALAGTNGLPSSSNKYITETDSRNTNARTPTGSAGGQLSGTYPNPSVVALTETSGPTALTIGAIADGYVLRRSGTTIAGACRIYVPSTTDPVSPSPADGDIYFNTNLKMMMTFDAGRSKWLSIDSDGFQVGRTTTTAAGAFYRGMDGLVLSATLGYVAFFNGTITAFSYTRSDSDSATFEITADGTTIASLASTATSGRSTSLNANFTAGQVLAVRNNAASNTTSDVQALVRFNFRT